MSGRPNSPRVCLLSLSFLAPNLEIAAVDMRGVGSARPLTWQLQFLSAASGPGSQVTEVTKWPCEACPPCHVTGLRAAQLCVVAEPPSPARQHPVCTWLSPTRPRELRQVFNQPQFGLRPGLGSHTQDRNRREERDGRCGRGQK